MNSTILDTYEIEGSSTTEIGTTEFGELSTIEEITSTTNYITNDLETANYKQGMYDASLHGALYRLDGWVYL